MLYDLIVYGTVVDPSQALHATRYIGIKDGVITALSNNLNQTDATIFYDVSGGDKIIAPGLVDLMLHPWPQQGALGLVADDVMIAEGSTTVVSPGDPGPGMLPSFRKQVVEPAKTRVFCYVMMSHMGYALWPSSNVPGFNTAYLASVDDLVGAFVAHSDICIGVKVLMSEQIIGTLDLLPIQRAVSACVAAEIQTGKTFRVMVHIGALRTPGLLSQIVNAVRPGDCITHCFDATPNSQGQQTGFGTMVSVATTAKQKGVLLDTGWGGYSADYLAAIAMLNAGIRPDTLSSDAHAAFPIKLSYVMSNLLALNVPTRVNGVSGILPLNPQVTVDDVVKWATWAPAQFINRIPQLGTLQVGAPGDIAVLRIETGSFTFTDTSGRQLTGAPQRIVLHKTIKAGILYSGIAYVETVGPSAGAVFWPGSYDLVERQFVLPAGMTVLALGAKLSVAVAAKVKIWRKEASGQYTPVAVASLAHTGSGAYEDAVLPSPFVVPNDGRPYHVGLYFQPAGTHQSISGINISFAAGDNTATVAMTEWSSNVMLSLRARYAA